nr:uncharacterized protein LOC123769802 [Procambarus clarkii]
MRVTVVSTVVVVLLAAMAATVPLNNSPGQDIDGSKTTIALAIAYQLIGLIPNETVQDLIYTIIDALTKEDFDYWGQVKDEVMALVGQYINEHNMHEVEVYQSDLVTLMDRYNQAPVQSDTYPDKNQQAAALSTSIVTHRYLVEAAELPQSMILHFEDISSIHVVVLKDVAETYSVEGQSPSRWWVDLDEQLDHYIDYGKKLEVELRSWRLGMVTCEKDYADGSCTNWEWIGTECYDVFTATDLVTGQTSSCEQLHGTTDCEDHCQLYTMHKEQEVEVFMTAKVTDVMHSWELLKNVSSVYAGMASRFYDPIGRH